MKRILIDHARAYATRAHEGMFRFKNPDAPMVGHLEEVAGLVEKAGGDMYEIAAAWLHDTVEDTGATIADIDREFGEEVARLVQGLTDPPEFESLPLGDRKELQAKRILSESRGIRLVKIADQISNVRFLASDPSDRWSNEICLIYVEGARQIVANCRGTSLYLEQLFQEAHQEAKRVYA